jgi:hypothetical protein
MKFSYTNIDFSDLRGTLLADYLIAVDADLKIAQAGRTIFEEPAFPIVELARSLTHWLAADNDEEFEFTSLSSDVQGIVTVARQGDGWVVFSSFSPELRSSALTPAQIAESLTGFIEEVRTDLSARELDADWILGLSR